MKGLIKPINVTFLSRLL